MLLFDLIATQSFGASKRHGGGKYGEIVLKKIIDRNLPVTCFYDSNKWLNPDIKNLIKSTLYDINEYSLEEIVDKTGATAIYSALPRKEIFEFNKCEVIGTIHGLRRLETPADINCIRYKNTSIKDFLVVLLKKTVPSLFTKMLCKYKLKEWENPMFRFVTVSNHSCYSIKTFFPSLKNKDIPVFYSPSTSVEKDLVNKTPEKYFLLVGGNRSGKNNLRAIMALDQLFSKGYIEKFRVKIAGAYAPSNYRYSFKNLDRFDFLGYVDDEDLEQLYHDAYALVYPSLNEGFGYPPLEAMHYGTPVVASPYASIPEVCEGAAIYFNPFSIEEIETRLLYISNESVRKEYSLRAKIQYDKVTSKQNSDLNSLVDYLYNA